MSILKNTGVGKIALNVKWHDVLDWLFHANIDDFPKTINVGDDVDWFSLNAFERMIDAWKFDKISNDELNVHILGMIKRYSKACAIDAKFRKVNVDAYWNKPQGIIEFTLK